MKTSSFIRIISVLIVAVTMMLVVSGCSTAFSSSTVSPTSSFSPFTEGSVNYKEYVKLGEYKNISVKKDIKVTEEDIFAEYVKMITMQKFDGVTDRPVKDGDAINIDYCGYLDGEKISGEEMVDFVFVIGYDDVLPNFAEACVGVMPGKEFDINVTIPVGYDNSQIAGKEVVYKTKVNYIIPEMSDETAKIATEGEYTSADALYKFIDEGLAEARESEWGQQMVNLIMEKVFRNSEIIKYPEGAIDVYIESFEKEYKNQGIENIAAYLGMTQAEYDKKLNEDAEYNMGCRLICYRIAEIEKISVTDEEINEYAEMNYVAFGYSSADQFIQTETREYMRETLLLAKVKEFLVNVATVVEVE